jgi:hypothetical protein
MLTASSVGRGEHAVRGRYHVLDGEVEVLHDLQPGCRSTEVIEVEVRAVALRSQPLLLQSPGRRGTRERGSLTYDEVAAGAMRRDTHTLDGWSDSMAGSTSAHGLRPLMTVFLALCTT